MGRQEDVLFCKIAITNGLVSQEQAQKCLTLCDRREKEGKRRPLIGAIFTKYNLMRPAEVQKLYQALNKRLGRATGPAARVAPAPRDGGRRKGDRRKGGRRGGRSGRGAERAKRIDPSLLWKGIAFGVVFVGVLIAMVVMFIMSGPTPESAETAGGGFKPAPTASSAGGSAGLAPATASSGAASGAPGGAAPAALEVDETFQRQHKTNLQQARREALLNDSPGRAVAMMEQFLRENAVGYKTAPSLEREAREALADFQRRARGEKSGAGEKEEGLP